MKEALKHRLIGAAVIAAVTVLFLPSFFKDRQAYQVNTESQIPDRPSITAVDFNEPEQVDDIEPAPAPDTMFLPEEGAALPTEVVKEVNPVTETGSVNTQSSIASKAVTPAVADMPLNAQGLPNAWVIQVASLGSSEAATKLRDQLQAEGHKAYVRVAESSNGKIHRVFIGPKLDKTEALLLKAQVDKRFNVKSIVLPFNP